MPTLTWNAVNYMQAVAADLLGDWPEGKPDGPDGERPAAWLMRGGGRVAALADLMRSWGYEVEPHEPGWLRISGRPTNVEAIRYLEAKRAQARLDWLREATAADLTRFATAL
ncbi:hypothetical protein ACIRPH_31655 [Nocardiopsis sp. NPDC101807]|uniref:hypothetical protein n=1 Tax=Nocardiopsis sp. NPDC101807 TaxID=3364339 RepID=UPI0037F5A5FA